MRLSEEFYQRHTTVVARELLGKYLVRLQDGRAIAGMITETEAYHSSRDLACHASKGFTPRTKVLFGPPGRTYVYLIYGMYSCLNFVTMRAGFPAAVLIRALDLTGCDGPGKLCRELKIDRALNDLPPNNSELWVEDREILIPRRAVKTTPRIGVDYAGAWAQKPWRFVLKKDMMPL